MDQEAKLKAAGIIADWEFAMDSGEFADSMTKGMRYVAAINTWCSRREFVDALASVGLNRGTLTKQFGLSRKFDAESYGVRFDAEGREMEAKEVA